jgi:hypothetical protein
MHWPPSLLILLPALAAGQGIEVQPLWEGRFVTGEPTEVEVRLTSPEGGDVRLRLSGAAGTVEHLAIAEAGRPLAVALPAYPGPNGSLRVAARLPDGTELTDEARLLTLPERLSASVGIGGSQSEFPGQGSTMVAPEALPRTAAGYRPLGALSLPPVALAQIDPAQTRALGAYFAGCGRIELLDATPELLARIRAAAGCGGRFVQGTGSPIPGSPYPLPASQGLEPLLAAGEASPIRALALLLLPYPLLLLGLSRVRHLGPWLLLLPPAATLAYAAALPLGTVPAQALTWAEAEAGDPSLRFVTLLRLSGADGGGPLHLPQEAGLPLPRAGVPTRLHLDADGGLSLPLPEGLLERQDHRLAGTRPLPWPLRLELAEGLVRIGNGGSGPSPGAWLLWRGRVYPVPALAPGMRHAVHAGDPTSDLPLQRLPVPDPGTALLLPLPPPAGLDERLRWTGWLLIRLPAPAASGGPV